MSKPIKTKFENARTYWAIYNQLKLLAINQFEWEGLEEHGIPEEYVEKLLYDFGRATFFNDDMNGYLCLQSSNSQAVNPYGYPLEYIVTGFGFHKRVKAEKSVLIRNNKLERPTDEVVRFYAEKLYQIARTCDTNVKLHKVPFLFLTDANTNYTFKNIFQKIDQNEVAIYADKNLDIDNSIKCVTTGAPFILDKLADYKHDVFNDFCTELGINNANTDKRERLITEEVTANNELIQNNLHARLSEREKACEQINKMFGLNISVKVRTEERGVNDVLLSGILRSGEPE